MSEEKITKHIYNKKILIFGSILLLLIIALFCWQWYCLDRKISDYKTEKEIQNKRFFKTKDFEFINLDSLEKNGQKVILTKRDIYRINENIKSLSEIVYQESNRAESIIDKDLDRLNLYMAIGIGFIAILGVFTPILVNILSVEDLREKMKEMPSADEIGKLSKDVKTALNKSTEIAGISESFDNLKNKTDKALPSISTLILQNAIGRFFNISPYILTNLNRKKDRQYFTDLLEYIRKGFDNCKNDKEHFISKDDFLKATIKDFCTYIKDPKSHSSAFTREISTEFYHIYNVLKELLACTDEKEIELYNKLDEKIKRVIDLINNIDA